MDRRFAFQILPYVCFLLYIYIYIYILVYVWTIKVLRNFSAAFVAALVIKLSKLIFNLVGE